ncbi:hypothetical protein COT72_04100 [archaeon CG10_big_fil_rev_8_21_14_0_10_43_11]|nr:MAG: hypothetical protein COT72_04100 [archaeon CG10_big_fil_rev_8_21_14_0_10_43_11]
MDKYKQEFTRLETALFSLLCKRAGEKLSQRELAGLLSVSPTAVSKAVHRLLDENLAKREKTRTAHFVSFNINYPRAIQLKRVENLRLVYVSGLSDFLEEKLAGATIILFGSYARGEDTKGSDIDIAVIGRKEKYLNVAAYEKELHKMININFYDSWKSIHKHLKNNLLNGIVLEGGVEL